MMQRILFSDVDGCIINELNPNFSLIQSIINQLDDAGIVLILATAKTAHEIISLNHHLNLPGPFIIENGGGILFRHPLATLYPSHDVICMDDYYLLKSGNIKPDLALLKTFSPISSILTQMIQLPHDINLSAENEKLSKIRFFTEPIYIKNLSKFELKRLKKQLHKHNIYYDSSDSFLQTYTSRNNNKGAALKFILSTIYADIKFTTFAIGDSFNDFSMLNRCDHAYYILNKTLKSPSPQWNLISEKGFSGWKKSIEAITSYDYLSLPH
ncbi:MAG: HAD hydrolase family protein [Legionella sp.]|jgi:HAD superfamily hydrolase (TIGR01484 family)|nr:HAD hydrolase family protein [Legionella sp.]